MRNNEKIKDAKNLKEYYEALSKKDKAAWDRIFKGGKSEKPETLAEYIQRTGCKTETRFSKKGVELVKVYFENGKIAEYEKSHLNTTTAF